MRRAICAATWPAVRLGIALPKRGIALTGPLLQRGADGRGAAPRGRTARAYPRRPAFDENCSARGEQGGQGGRRGGGFDDYNNDRNSDGRVGGVGRYAQRGRGALAASRRQADAPRRRREDYLMQNAQELLEMKRQYKHAKDVKTRQAIRRNACILISRTRIDPSSQDEKSITVLLNCAATFRCHPSEGVVQAVQWMRTNLAGLNPQGVALFANALGAVRPYDAHIILVSEVMPVVQALQKELAPVEVVMILQACTRLFVKECDVVQTQLLHQLHPCIADMPVPQLSTLFTALPRHPMRVTDAAGWLAIVHEITLRALDEDTVKTMFSKEAVTFVSSAPFLPLADDVVCRLLRRLQDTCQFHTTEDAVHILAALAAFKHRQAPSEQAQSQQAQSGEPHATVALTPQLTQSMTELLSALHKRLERVAQFATVKQVAHIWSFAHRCGLALSAEVHHALLRSLEFQVKHRRVIFSHSNQVARAAALYTNLPSLEAFRVISDSCVGIRPKRDDADAAAPPVAAETAPEMHVVPFTYCFSILTAIRLSLEDVFAAHKATPPASLTTLLPELLAKHVAEAPPFALLVAAANIVRADPACALRNTTNDAVILAAVEAKLKDDAAAFVSQVKPSTLQRFMRRTLNYPRAEPLRALLPREVSAATAATTTTAEEEHTKGDDDDDDVEAVHEEEEDEAAQRLDGTRH